jgi:hypothetical protein
LYYQKIVANKVVVMGKMVENNKLQPFSYLALSIANLGIMIGGICMKSRLT